MHTECFATGSPYIGVGEIWDVIWSKKKVNTSLALFLNVAGQWRFQAARREK
jgi:hypothetical protein